MTDESLTYSSPIFISSEGQRQLIVWTQESVTSLDPELGLTRWRQRLNTSGDYAVSTPVFHDNRLLIGGLMLELDRAQPAAAVLWPASRAPSRRIFSHTSTALFRGSHIYTARSTGELLCVDAGTGKEVWEATTVTGLENGASIHLTPPSSSPRSRSAAETSPGRLRHTPTAESSQSASRPPPFSWTHSPPPRLSCVGRPGRAPTE